jgi:hypothetical protein
MLFFQRNLSLVISAPAKMDIRNRAEPKFSPIFQSFQPAPLAAARRWFLRLVWWLFQLACWQLRPPENCKPVGLASL